MNHDVNTEVSYQFCVVPFSQEECYSFVLPCKRLYKREDGRVSKIWLVLYISEPAEVNKIIDMGLKRKHSVWILNQISEITWLDSMKTLLIQNPFIPKNMTNMSNYKTKQKLRCWKDMFKSVSKGEFAHTSKMLIRVG